MLGKHVFVDSPVFVDDEPMITGESQDDGEERFAEPDKAVGGVVVLFHFISSFSSVINSLARLISML